MTRAPVLRFLRSWGALRAGLLAAAVAGCTAGTGAARPGAGSGGGDASGSGGRGGAGPVGISGLAGIGGGSVTETTGTGGAHCGLQSFDLTRKPAEILLLLDRSASMQEPPSVKPAVTTPKWDLIVPALEQVVRDTSATVQWGLKVFPEGEGDACVAGSVTDRVDVPIAANNATAVLAAIERTTDEGNGTPTGDAVAAAAAYLRTLATNNRKYILLATDGEPSCAGTKEGQSSARPHALAAVGDAANAGIHTFVVGVATTKDSATDVLNDLAEAGLEPRTDPALRYYLGTTQADLSAALALIAGQASSCVFPLTPPPPIKNDPAKLGVYLDAGGTKIPYDGSALNGWAFVDAENSALEVHGAWCDAIKNASADQVQIVYGCPAIDVP
jgi:hypothetical protein